MDIFTPENPCRCGFKGEGFHQCHAGRETGDRCPMEAKPRLIASLSSLAGMQMKTGAVIACYCEGCFAEAFPSHS
jgi:hypothetical protein